MTCSNRTDTAAAARGRQSSSVDIKCRVVTECNFLARPAAACLGPAAEQPLLSLSWCCENLQQLSRWSTTPPLLLRLSRLVEAAYAAGTGEPAALLVITTSCPWKAQPVAAVLHLSAPFLKVAATAAQAALCATARGPKLLQRQGLMRARLCCPPPESQSHTCQAAASAPEPLLKIHPLLKAAAAHQPMLHRAQLL